MCGRKGHSATLTGLINYMTKKSKKLKNQYSDESHIHLSGIRIPAVHCYLKSEQFSLIKELLTFGLKF